MGLIRRLGVEQGAGTELATKLTENLKEILADNKVRVCIVHHATDMKHLHRHTDLC